MTIQFICRGNAFRSIIAQAYLNSLNIPGLTVLSSGTIASANREADREDYTETLELLRKHGIEQFAKDHHADDVQQSLLDKSDIAICLNNVVYKEATASFKLPKETYVWDVADIDERGHIATAAGRQSFRESAYKEITTNVDELVSLINQRNKQ